MLGGETESESVDRGGRPAVTTPHELAKVAQRLFVESGFEATSVDDIARAAGIGRRTFFRYFPTKADTLFSDSPAELDRLRSGLAATAPGEPYRAVVIRAVVGALTFAPEDRDWALQRARLILTEPVLMAHATVVFARWRGAAADFVRRCVRDEEFFARAVGHAVLAATLAAHEEWIAHPDAELADALAGMLELILPLEPT